MMFSRLLGERRGDRDDGEEQLRCRKGRKERGEEEGDGKGKKEKMRRKKKMKKE